MAHTSFDLSAFQPTKEIFIDIQMRPSQNNYTMFLLITLKTNLISEISAKINQRM